jgi:hypothetical protein
MYSKSSQLFSQLVNNHIAPLVIGLLLIVDLKRRGYATRSSIPGHRFNASQKLTPLDRCYALYTREGIEQIMPVTSVWQALQQIEATTHRQAAWLRVFSSIRDA